MAPQSAHHRRQRLVWMVFVTLLALAWMGVAGSAQIARAQAPTAGTYPKLDSPDPNVRAEAVQEIRAAQDHNAAIALIDHIEDPDQRTGLYIAQALIELAPPDVVSLLQASLLSGNADGRWRAAYVLGARKETRAASMLAHALRDEDVLVSRTAAEALAKIGTPAATKALIAALTSSRPAEIHAAMNGLLLLGDAAVPALAEALESNNWQVEYSAAVVLEAIGTPSAVAALTHLTAQ